MPLHFYYFSPIFIRVFLGILLGIDIVKIPWDRSASISSTFASLGRRNALTNFPLRLSTL